MSKPKLNIAVLCGGVSSEREVSLKTGVNVFKNLARDKYNPALIEIASDGRWLLKSDFLALEKIKKVNDKDRSLILFHQEKGIVKNDLKNFDLVFMALHGKFSEDGRIQSVLELLGIPYTGSGVLASALGMDKIKANIFLNKFKIKMPKFLPLYNPDFNLEKVKKIIAENIKFPCVVKPNGSGSSVGITIVDAPEKLKSALAKAFQEDKNILIEEYISGMEITCGVLGNANKTKLFTLPPVEIIPAHRFFDYESKYSAKATQEICPARISKSLTKKIQDIAKKVHLLFGCDGLTRSDFIIRKNQIYFLEINTLPGLTEQSLCPKEARAVGMSFTEFLDKIIELALVKNQK